MKGEVSDALRSKVRDRAKGCCEYCLLHEDDIWVPHEPDHIIAIKHRGETTLKNLAWTCFNCNRHKGTDLASIDPEGDRIVRLFLPRRDRWGSHFRLVKGEIVAKTSIGRVTAFLLQFNRIDRVRLRRILIAKKLYPPI